MSHSLLEPYQLTAKLTLKNRVVMAPMTRSMSNEDFMATTEMANYYARRAEAGLIISEGTVIQSDGTGYPNVPGIFLKKHVEAWKKTTEAVHQKNGKIFQQIWHVGRVSHPDYLNGVLPISASATMMSGSLPRRRDLQYGRSRAASVDEIQQIIQNFVAAAENSMAAGFDGIEIHGANGYLVDQFLHYDTNRRQDQYGQAPENMSRFVQEIVTAIGQAIGYEHVGIRLSPGTHTNQIQPDSRDADVFKVLLNWLSQQPIAYVHTGNYDDQVLFPALGNRTMTDFMRLHYQGNLMAAGGYTPETAQQGIAQNRFNLVAFGRPFIANPDLMSKLSKKVSLASYQEAMLETLV